MIPNLKQIERQHKWWEVWKVGRKYYELVDDVYVYFSELTGNTLTIQKGWRSDGATFAFDVDGSDDGKYPPPWLPHDIICERGHWDDGTPISRKGAADELEYLMLKVGCSKLRAKAWRNSTYWFGCAKVKGQ